jgi:uncharacterized membrane protein/YHS domain-containing protein
MTINRRFIFSAALFAAWAAPTTVAQGQPPAPINETCPVMEGEPVDPDVTYTYRGQVIGLCCQRCLRKFKTDPEPYLVNLAAFRVPADGPEAANARQPGEKANDRPAAKRDDGGRDAVATASDDGPRMPFAGRLHPVIVHAPVAGVPLACLGFLVWIVTGRESFARADVAPLFIGTLGAVAAYLTGDVAYEHSRYGESMDQIAERHETVATVVMICCLVLTALRIWRWNRLTGRWRWAYGAGTIVVSALLGVTGYLGGSLVFGPDHLSF